jgi:hypothetical protein
MQPSISLITTVNPASFRAPVSFTSYFQGCRPYEVKFCVSVSTLDRKVTLFYNIAEDIVSQHVLTADRNRNSLIAGKFYQRTGIPLISWNLLAVSNCRVESQFYYFHLPLTFHIMKILFKTKGKLKLSINFRINSQVKVASHRFYLKS